MRRGKVRSESPGRSQGSDARVQGGKAQERGKSKKKVTNPKQAIAIGLSQARKKGAKVPKKKG